MHPDLCTALARIVSFRTVPGNLLERRACLDWIEKEFLSHASLKVERGDAAGVPYLYLRHPNPSLLWFAHADVVPGTDRQFAVKIDGDRALGRGVKDMKGAALTFLIAYRDACKKGIVAPVSVLITTDEETGGKSLEELHAQKKFPNVPVAFTPDTGEHPGIVTDLKGAAWVRLIADGKGAHGGMPWLGDNPVPRLAEAIQAIVQHYPAPAAPAWEMTVTPTQLVGSDAFNKIPDDARATLDIRFPASVCAIPEEAIERVQKILPRGCRLETIVTADPLSTDSGHPMVRRIQRLAEKVLGSPVPFHRENGSSDARAFGAAGIPAFLYGPEGGDLHGAAEWVSLKSLDQHVTLNTLLLEELSRETA